MSEAQKKDWKSTGKTLRSIQTFHDKYAKYPKEQVEEAKVKFVEYMTKIEKVLRAQNLCKRLEYTGSTYENLKIISDELEFDVMFIRDGKGLEVVPIASMSGYSFLKPSKDAVDFTDDAKDKLLPNTVVSRFFGAITKWVNAENLDKLIDVSEHGPAIQIKVYKNEGDSWFKVDLVPAYEILTDGKPMKFVPKRVKNADRQDLNSAWRRSFSEEEKALLKGIDKDNGCRKKTLRILKAIRLLDGPFKALQSYHLKTLLFHATKNKELRWSEKDLADRVFGLMHDLQIALEKRDLNNFFVSKMNLFESLQPVTVENVADRIRRLLRNEEEFMSVIDPKKNLSGS